jgi:phage-related protein
VTADEIARLQVTFHEKGFDKIIRKLGMVEAQGERTSKATEKVEKRFSHLDDTVGDFNRSMTATRNVMSLVKWPAMIAGAGMAAQTVGALGAGVVALGSALAPASGAAAGAVVIYSALGQAFGVTKLALMGLDKAIAGDEKALAKLNPTARKFVDEIRGAKKDVEGLQGVAQKGLFPGAGRAIENLRGLLPTLRPIIAGTASALGDLAEKASEMFTSKAWRDDITKLGGANIKIIRNLGDALLSAADGARNIIAEAIPLATWLSKVAKRFAENASEAIGAARETGKLADFFAKTKDVLKTLGSIFVDVAVGLFNIGKAAAPLGRELLGDIEKLAEKFREWTESMSGKRTLREYFAAAEEPIREVAGLVGDVVAAFLRLSKPRKETTMLISKLRELVPILESLISGTTTALAPALIDAAANLARVLAIFIGSSGPLVHFVRLIGVLAGALADLLEKNPQLQTMAVTFVGLLGVMKLMKGVLGPLIGVMKGLAAATLGQAAATEIANAATVRQRIGLALTAIQLRAITVASWLATAATTALGVAVAIATSPITLIVVGIIALAAALVLAYKESETFRKIVDATWAAVKVAADWLVTAGVAAFEAVSAAVTDAWDAIRSATSKLWGWFGPYIKGVWEVVKVAANTYFTVYKTIITSAWTVIKTATTTIWNALKFYLETTWTAIKTLATTYFNLVKLAILTPIRAARDVLMVIWPAIQTAATTAWGVLKTLATTAWDAIKTAILTPIRAARDLIGGKDGIWSQIKDIGLKAWDGITTAFGKAIDPIKDVILAPFRAAFRGVKDFAIAILNVVGKIPGVDTEKWIKAVQGFELAKGGVYQAFAHGGAFARTQGVVSKPITLMGEEAPRHPEFVIPTNPAYRDRAKGLLAQAAGAIGFAEGGVVSAFRSAIGRTSPPPKAQLGLFEAGIVESGLRNLTYGDADSRGALQVRDSTARGMGLDNMNPFAVAMAFLTRGFWGKGSAISLANNNPTMTAGWVAQQTQGSAFPERYDQVMGQALAYLKGKTGGGGWDLLSALNPLDLIKKLPSPGDLLPGWLTGLGTWVIKQVTGHIKDQLFGGSGHPGAGGGGSGKVVQVGQWLQSLGYQVGEHPAFGGVTAGVHDPDGFHPLGRAIDVNWPNVGEEVAKLDRIFPVLQKMNPAELLWRVTDHFNHLHVAFMKGGEYGGLPFLGSYHSGGVAPREGLAHVAKGEEMTPAGRGGVDVHLHFADGMQWLKDFVRVEIVERDRAAASAYNAGVVTG